MSADQRLNVVALSGQKLLMHRLEPDLEIRPCITRGAAYAALAAKLPQVLLVDLDHFNSPFVARQWLKGLPSSARKVPLVLFGREPAAFWVQQLADDLEAILHEGPIADRPLLHTVLQAHSLLSVPA